MRRREFPLFIPARFSRHAAASPACKRITDGRIDIPAAACKSAARAGRDNGRRTGYYEYD